MLRPKNKSWNRLEAEREIGNKYGSLTITGVNRSDKNRTYRYAAVCDCGIIKEYCITKLRSGHTSSCGCLRKKLLSDRSKTHGLSKHPLFRVWTGMKSRCYNEKMDNYEYYGAIGVTVCDEWRNSFKCFHTWAMDNGWKPGLQIDRFPNKFGNYEPNNCRITTRIKNMNNKIKNRLFEIDGENLTSREISERFSMNLSQLNSRIAEGWDIQRAVHTPFRKASPSLP